MSAKAQTNWLATGLVALISAAIGFGAVYVMVGGGDNRPAQIAADTPDGGGKAEPQAAAATKPSAAAGTDGTRSDAAAPGGTTAGTNTGTNTGTTGGANIGAGLAGPDGKPLNRGAMTTFVFKKTPMALPDDVRFQDKDGNEVGIEQFTGKVVLMNLWATWCAPCRKEMPDLDKLQAELGSERFEVVAVSLDRGSADKPRQFLAEIGIKSLAFYHDPNARIGFKLMAIGMPTTLLIDEKGREVGRLVGPADWHSQDAKKLVKAVLAAQGS